MCITNVKTRKSGRILQGHDVPVLVNRPPSLVVFRRTRYHHESVENYTTRGRIGRNPVRTLAIGLGYGRGFSMGAGVSHRNCENLIANTKRNSSTHVSPLGRSQQQLPEILFECCYIFQSMGLSSSNSALRRCGRIVPWRGGHADQGRAGILLLLARSRTHEILSDTAVDIQNGYSGRWTNGRSPFASSTIGNFTGGRWDRRRGLLDAHIALGLDQVPSAGRRHHQAQLHWRVALRQTKFPQRRFGCIF